jgi:hypothetical protein
VEANQGMAKLNKGTISQEFLTFESQHVLRDGTPRPGYLNGWHKMRSSSWPPSVLFLSAC